MQEDCSDIWKFVERMITKRNIATLSSTVFATYIARQMGTVDVGNIICSFDEALISVIFPAIFKIFKTDSTF
jgi:hypothetical protein